MKPIKRNLSIIGVDNGVTGSIGIIYTNDTSDFFLTPVIRERSYTKKTQYIHRINWVALKDILSGVGVNSLAYIERPLVNQRAFAATGSALRALEATLIVLEMMDIPYVYIDSKTWQKEFISSSVIGHDKMKKASKDVGITLYPWHKDKIEKHGDADGLLIARYGAKSYSG